MKLVMLCYLVLSFESVTISGTGSLIFCIIVKGFHQLLLHDIN